MFSRPRSDNPSLQFFHSLRHHVRAYQPSENPLCYNSRSSRCETCAASTLALASEIGFEAPRGLSPAGATTRHGQNLSEVSNNSTVTSEDQPLPRKNAVRVSFDESNYKVGEAAGQETLSSPIGELSMGRKRKLKSPNLADANDTPPGKPRKTTGADSTTREDIKIARGLHNLVIDTEDTTKLASSLSYARKEDSVRPIDDQKGIFPTVLPNFRQSSLAQQKRGLRASSSLCKRCRKIDLDKLLSTKYKTSSGWPAGGLTNISTWEADTCVLCNLLRSTLPPYVPDNHIKIALRAYSSKRIHYMGWSSVDTNMLQILAEYSRFSGRYIVSQPSGIKGPVQMIQENIERYETVKNWISLCQVMHTTVCMIKGPSTVRYQKLIDCQTRALVPAEDHPYVALSYVWGSIPEVFKFTDGSEQLPTKIPRTIEDAITITQKLDFRYLWVDRYCINQQPNDEQETKEKAYQVGKMDLIYMNAELTIIAAAGSNPNYGLPGVGHQKRKSRHLTTCTRIGKHFLITTADTPTTSVYGTEWNTRGWTFQEALLSRRRLVFTEEQMYFECHGMYCCESLKFPLEYMHRKDKQGFKKNFCENGLVGAFPKGIGSTNFEIVRRIEEYTKRTLTNSHDILNGMLGIFNAFERSDMEVKHCMGIPILPPMTRAPNRGDISKQVQGWNPAMGFLVGLCWDLEKSAERRSGFPSWSWTGWQSTVSWRVGSLSHWPAITVDPNVEFSIECTDGQILSWKGFQESKKKATMQPQMSGIIRITAWTIQFPIVSQTRPRSRSRDKHEYITWLELEDGGILDWQFESISNVLFEPGQLCTGIFLDHPSRENDSDAIIMVFIQKGEIYKRIGLGKISHNNKRFDKNGKEVVTKKHDESGYVIYDGVGLNPVTLSKSWKEVRLG
jgi:hypothetical protein